MVRSLATHGPSGFIVVLVALAGVGMAPIPPPWDLTIVDGPLDDAGQHPGWSREPNHPSDLYPAASYAACNPSDWPVGFPQVSHAEAQHRGHCDVWATPPTYRQAPAAYGDLLALRPQGKFSPGPLGVPGGCGASSFLTVYHAKARNPCQAGMLLVHPTMEETPTTSGLRATDDHRLVLGPGNWFFAGAFGAWQDTPHAVPENGVVQTYHADGWVGHLTARTGTWRYLGYADVTSDCQTEDGMASAFNPLSYSVCEPYLFGDLQNPQGYGPGPGYAGGEWAGSCLSATPVTLTPTGPWPAGSQVHPGYLLDVDALAPSPPPPVPIGGSALPVVLAAACSPTYPGMVTALDVLELPLGNLGVHVLVEVEVAVHVPGSGTQHVLDADFYWGWKSEP